jgi:hypothetical protein
MLTVTPSPQGEIILPKSIWKTLGVDPVDPKAELEVRVFDDHIEIHPRNAKAASKSPSSTESVYESEQDVGC